MSEERERTLSECFRETDPRGPFLESPGNFSGP